MKKILLFFAALAFAFNAMAQTVTLDFTRPNAWGFPSAYVNTATSYTNGSYTITINPGSDGSGWKIQPISSTADSALLIGKTGASIDLPAFDFAVSKIVVNGASGASGRVTFNVFDGTAAVSTQVTGATGSKTFMIDASHQAAGTVFSIKNTNSNNNQITSIEIYEAAAGAPEAPTFGVAAGTYTSAQSVTLACATTGAEIHYTTDGTTPTASSTLYTGAITVSTTTTIKAIAVNNGVASASVEATYTIVATEGQGTKENPYTLADVKLLNNSGAKAWVVGTIYGVYSTTTNKPAAADTTTVANLAIVTGNDTIPVALPSGSVRTALNLVDNPTLVGTDVKVYGDLERYFLTTGVKNTSDYELVVEAVPATAISLNKTTLALLIGAKDTLVATVTPANSTEAVVWSTSDAAVATVSKGIVTAVAAGTATITATSGEFNATCAVTVTAPVVPDVAAPTISPASCRFKNSIEVTITAEEGMVIFYTTDGSSPEDFINEYSAPITLTQTATVKAIALNPENEAISSVAEVTYTKIEPMTCAQAAAVEKDGEIELGQVTVAYVNYKNIYVVDATGAYLVYDNDSLVCGLKEGTTALKAGDVVTGLAGVSSPYKNLPEMKVTSAYDDLTVVAGTAPASTEMTTAPVAADVNKIVVLKNVLMTAAGSFTTSATTNLTGKMGETDVTIRNNFRIAQTFTAATYYDITCAVAIYNTTMQVYFISATQVEATVTSIAISGTPTKLTYEAGEAFDPAGLTVTATYNVGSTADVTASVEWTLNPATLAEGDTQCEVTATVGTVSSEAYTVNGLTVTAAVAKSTCTFDLSTASYDAATIDQVKWSNEDVRMVADKASASTVANNYVPAEGNSYTSSRFYKSSKLTIRPEVGVKIMSIEYTATTEGYATALKNSTWTNATAAVSADNSKLVVITPTDGTAEVVATIGATTGASGVTVTYVKAESMTVADAIDAVTDMAGDATAKSDYVTVTGYVTAINGTTYTIAETAPAAGAMKRVAAASESTLDIINPSVKNSTANLPVVGTKVVAAGYLTEAGMVDATLQGVNENGNATAIDAVEAEGIQKVMRDGKVIIIKNGVEYSVMGQKL